MNSVEIPIRERKKPPMIKFPNRCVNCEEPKGMVMPLKLNMGVQKRDHMVMMPLPVPLCGNCEQKERKITNVTLLPFTIAGFAFFVLGFIPAWLFTPEGSTPQTLGFSVTVGALVGIVAGLIGGTLVEFGLRFVFAPLYGQLLIKRPLTVFSLFDDSEHVVGLSARFLNNKKSLLLIFENDDLALEFKKLNPEEKP